ncbi:MAG: hypothetical protein GY803_12710 [Chloroflexi bacterium]|nr:hypothetical protein [Chloroflexota bacterium]
MPYAPFHEKFPEIAFKETRSFRTFNNPDLGNDEFGLIELYCDETGCDCRRVMFNVVSQRQEKDVAVIAFGWESAQFYADWFGGNDPDIIREMQGPELNMMSAQSKLAPALLEAVKEILQDKQYVDRLKRHYAMFRETVKSEPSHSRRRQRKKTRRKKRRRR